MNFGEKITNLRKQQGLSQEELGEKLNVTRQTISKWELGQTSPDTAKLTEISNFFGIGVNELTNEDEIKFNKYSTEDSESKKPVGIIILIVVLCAILLTIVVYLTSLFMAGKSIFNRASKIIKKSENIENIAEDLFTDAIGHAKDGMNKMNEENGFDKFNKSSFNSDYEFYSGTKYAANVKKLLDKVITNNKTNNEHIITVENNGTVTTKEDEIVKIKYDLNNNMEYEVSLDYDENGYVNKVTVYEMGDTEFEKQSKKMNQEFEEEKNQMLDEAKQLQQQILNQV